MLVLYLRNQKMVLSNLKKELVMIFQEWNIVMTHRTMDQIIDLTIKQGRHKAYVWGWVQF